MKTSPILETLRVLTGRAMALAVLALVPLTAQTVTVDNPSFEIPTQEAAGFNYYGDSTPSGQLWAFGGGSGLSANGGPWYGPSAPDGVQGGFMQGDGASISQEIQFDVAGGYTVSFSVVGRATYGSRALSVKIDGITVYSLSENQISTAAWASHTTAPFTVTAGPHTLAFVAGAGGDATAIDNVQIVSAPLVPPTTAEVGSRTIVTFTGGVGYWTVPDGVTSVDVLVVGGGGGGGGGVSAQYGAGGGAGGLIYQTSLAVAGSVSVTVGGGGNSGTYSNGYIPARNGGNSSFDSLTALGGGGGAVGNAPGNAGGSGGGGFNTYSGGTAQQTASSSGGFGNNGAAGPSGAGGGGGGAGFAGNSCNGGDGLAYDISGTSKYYAGGGEGAGGSSAGLGGGGTIIGGSGQAGTVNTGGGGGAAWGTNNSGAGGSGIVIVSYNNGATTYTVSFDSNGGSEVSNQTVASGGMATQPTPAPTKAGYAFAGWYSDSGLLDAFNFATTPIVADTTLYAKWTVTYTVSFDSNGGSAVSDQTVASDSMATQPVPAPTLLGHTLVEWCSDIELLYAFDFDTTPITGDTTLYAKWALSTYLVSFISNGGSAVDSQAVTYNTTAAQPADPTRDGYSFSGWYADAGFATPFVFSTPITAATTLYAKWILNLQYSTTSSGADTIITFTAGGGTWTPPAGVTSVEVMVVGGGGGGGGGTAHQWGGGGGAGGLIYNASVAVEGPVAVAVGDGGRSGQQVDGTNGGLPHVADNGGDSTFGTLIALGGGGGSNSQNGGISARDGGSGGGGYNNAPAGVALQPGSTSGGFGNNGAVGINGPGGGGGGAGTAGGGTDGKGGDGLSYSISGSDTYYAGGGAGAGGTAGLGGGGEQNASGTANTGGGGGGARQTDGPGAGGSGVVIIRYTVVGSPFETWANGTFSPPLTQKLPGDDQDSDGLTNLQEYAFDTEPTVSFSGGIEYVLDGAVTTHGQPVMFPQGNDYFTVFGRRTDHATAGLTYKVQFSADLDFWVDNDDLENIPVQVATDGTIDAIQVKYPSSIVTDSGSQKPTFSRVMVVGN